MSIYSLDDITGLRNAEAIKRRLRYIDGLLRWTGFLSRSSICNYLKISPQQASSDISLYRNILPDNCYYDKKGKQYLATKGFAPLFTESFRIWRNEFGNDLAPFEVISYPTPEEDDDILQQLIAAEIKRTPVEIRYQSTTTTMATVRIICPLAIVDTGTRLHVRAFDKKVRSFRDFVLGRIIWIEPSEGDWVSLEADSEWHEEVVVRIEPNRAFENDQRGIISKEYGMTEGRLEINTRKALLWYVLDRLHLLQEAGLSDKTPTTLFSLIDKEWRVK